MLSISFFFLIIKSNYELSTIIIDILQKRKLSHKRWDNMPKITVEFDLNLGNLTQDLSAVIMTIF